MPEALLVKYLAGEASYTEAMAVDEWLTQSPAHAKELKQLMQLWAETGRQESHIAPDIKAAWNRAAADREQVMQQEHAKQTRAIRHRWIAAALLLILAGSTYLLLRQRTANHIPGMHTISASADIIHQTLPDSSVVVLLPGSALHYPAQFPAGEKTVSMEGEAYFNIKPDAVNPFTVQIDDLRIKVIGTAFNVKKGKDSIIVQVDNGTVQLSNAKKMVVVKGGMQAIYLKAAGTFYLSKLENGNNYAYATRVFQFTNIRLEQAAAILSKAYNVPIVLENKKLADCTISTTFTNMSLEDVLEIIAAALSIQYRINGSTILVSGNECN